MHNHESWLKYATIDLLSAKCLFKEGNLESAAVYHCQQCAEKSLKAFLVYSGETPQKTHDLSRLIFLCQKHDANFATLKLSANSLTAFATQTRYPSEFDIPDEKDVKKFIQMAENILSFVKNCIKQPHQ
jgi:HEPN domain-containing protein